MIRIVFTGLFLMASLQAAAGTVSGRINPGQDLAVESTFSDSCFWRLGYDPVTTPAQKSLSGPVLVVLEGEAPGEKQESEADATPLTIYGYEFSDELVAVVPEAELQIKNSDPRAYSCSAKGSNAFDIKGLKPGATHSQRFGAAGEARLICSGYPFMQATILVVDSPYLSRADKLGEFQIRRVPAGNYKIKAYYRGAWRWEQEVEVPTYGTVRVTMGIATESAVPPAKARPEDIRKPLDDEPSTSKKADTDKKPPEREPPAKDKAEGGKKRKSPKAQKSQEKKQPDKKQPVKTPVEKPKGDKKKQGEHKPPKNKEKKTKQPDKKKEPETKPAEDVKPAFENVEPEIEIEEE